MLVYHFADPDLGIEIVFGEEGQQNKRGVGFEIGIEVPVVHSY